VADSLAPSAVRPLLSGRFGQDVYLYEEQVPSTQRLLQPEHPEGAVAVAEEQSEGRGRLGRRWHAPARSSVLVSIMLRPEVDPPRLPELSLVMGGAVAEAIAEVTGLEPTIKFPNDLLLGGKKVAGILAESSEGRVVVGIGVNVNQTTDQLPAAAQTEPTSLRLEGGEEVDRAALLAAVLLRAERAYENWRATATGTSASG
jgi:BirA family transcriptional regulator, biotin operon repressor / biotin---[acetyl-CoA-carboxylase] ligase